MVMGREVCAFTEPMARSRAAQVQTTVTLLIGAMCQAQRAKKLPFALSTTVPADSAPTFTRGSGITRR